MGFKCCYHWPKDHQTWTKETLHAMLVMIPTCSDMKRQRFKVVTVVMPTFFRHSGLQCDCHESKHLILPGTPGISTRCFKTIIVIYMIHAWHQYAYHCISMYETGRLTNSRAPSIEAFVVSAIDKLFVVTGLDAASWVASLGNFCVSEAFCPSGRAGVPRQCTTVESSQRFRMYLSVMICVCNWNIQEEHIKQYLAIDFTVEDGGRCSNVFLAFHGNLDILKTCLL